MERPWTFEDVAVGSGDVDLGVLEAPVGTTVTVRLVRGEQPIPANVSVHATLLDQPDIHVGSHQLVPGDPPSIVLRDLAPGTHRVRVQPLYSRGALFETQIECNGTPQTLDARLP